MTTSAAPSPAMSGSGQAITVFRWLVTAFLAVVVVLAIAQTVEVFTSDTLVAPLELSVAPTDIDPGYPAGASIVEASAYVDVEAGLGHRLLWWLVTDALALLAIPFLVILRRMLAKGAEPFTAENERRLRWLIGLSLAFAVTDSLRPVVSIAIQQATGFDGFGASLEFSSLFVALVLGALLEVWRHGVSLRSEQELTI